MANTYYSSTLDDSEIEAALEAIDGVISASNDGKILCIEDGKIKAKSASELGDVTLESLSVTANGDYTPGAGVDGYDEVHVAVPNSYAAGDEGKVVKNGSLVAQAARASQITQNGTYDTTENNSVTVNVSGGGGSATLIEKSISANGTYNASSDNADGYSKVVVNVSGGGGGGGGTNSITVSQNLPTAARFKLPPQDVTAITALPIMARESWNSYSTTGTAMMCSCRTSTAASRGQAV